MRLLPHVVVAPCSGRRQTAEWAVRDVARLGGAHPEQSQQMLDGIVQVALVEPLLDVRAQGRDERAGHEQAHDLGILDLEAPGLDAAPGVAHAALAEAFVQPLMRQAGFQHEPAAQRIGGQRPQAVPHGGGHHLGGIVDAWRPADRCAR